MRHRLFCIAVLMVNIPEKGPPLMLPWVSCDPPPLPPTAELMIMAIIKGISGLFSVLLGSPSWPLQRNLQLGPNGNA